MSMQSSLKSLESRSLSGSFYSDHWSCSEIRRLQEAGAGDPAETDNYPAV